MSTHHPHHHPHPHPHHLHHRRVDTDTNTDAFPPPPTASVWERLPPAKSTTDIFSFYDRKTIYSLFLFYLFTKGMLAGAGVLSLIRVSFCRKTLEIGAQECQVMSILATIPWCLRGVVAVALSTVKSAFPVAYERQIEVTFIVAATGVGVACLLPLGLLRYSSIVAGVLMGGVTLAICVLDVIYNGVYSALVARGQAAHSPDSPNYASMLIFSSTALVQIGAVLAAAFVGPIAENFDPRLIFFVALFVMGTNFVPVFAGWLGEISISELPARAAPEFQAYARFRNITVLTALAAIANAFMSIASDDAVAIALFAVFSLSVLLYLNYYIFAVDERVDAELKTMLLDKARDSRSDFYAVGSTVIFVQAALYVNIVGAEAFFFTARDGCPATSPQFSYVDYSTTGAIVAAAAGWAGVVLYRNYFSSFNLQSGFTLTLWLHLSVRSLRVLLPLGVYDTAPASNWPFFLAVYCVLGAVTGYMFVMPSVVLTPAIVPQEHATVGFASTVSLQSYAKVVATQLGLFAIDVARLQANDACDYCNLWLMQFSCHVLAGALCIPVFYIFVPRVRL